jgi:hypothetical protein
MDPYPLANWVGPPKETHQTLTTLSLGHTTRSLFDLSRLRGSVSCTGAVYRALSVVLVLSTTRGVCGVVWYDTDPRLHTLSDTIPYLSEAPSECGVWGGEIRMWCDGMRHEPFLVLSLWCVT